MKIRQETRQRGGLHIALLLAPALLVVGVFFVGGISYALLQSLGYQPFIGRTQLSLDAYRNTLADEAVHASVAMTLRLALTATAGSAVLGVGLAVVVNRVARGRRAAMNLLQTNLAVPHIVAAVAVGMLLSQTGLISRLAHAMGWVNAPSDFPALVADQHGIGIVAAYMWKETPFIAILALTALRRGTQDLGRAAQVLGAGPFQRLCHVTLPAVAPPVAAGSVLVFVFALGSYEVPYLLGRPYPATLPVVAYQYYTDIDLTYRAEAMAVAVLTTLTSIAAAIGFLTLLSRVARRPA